MNFTKFIFVISALLNVSMLLAGNNVVHVRSAQGRCEVSGDITLAQAEERALMEAKKEALSKAGVMENVWSVMGQISSSNGDQFSEAYSSVSALAINGLVNVLNKDVQEVWDKNLKRLFKVVTIEADVTRNDVQEDLTYKLDVKGIDPVYKEGDLFQCSFALYGWDSHVKVFWFTNDEAAMIYPNELEDEMLFKAGQSYNVPVTNEVELFMAKSNPAVETEFINIIVLATKQDYPYLGKMDFLSILSWIYSIPADQRVLVHESTIVK